MDELLASGIKLAHGNSHSAFFDDSEETKASKSKGTFVNCPSPEVCIDWAKYQKNVSILFFDTLAEINYASGNFIGEKYKPLLCKLDDGVVFTYSQSMIMFYGDPLMKRVNEIISRVVEAGLYNYPTSLRMNLIKVQSRKIAIAHPLDEYYSFNLYHMLPAFYLILMGWCLSALCFMVEVKYNSVLYKRVRCC
jgi:hypothetical protein